MRASGIDALAAPVGERVRPVAPEQRRQPARHVAAHHVAVAAIGRPARGEMGKDQLPPLKAALQRLFKVEQAEIILPPLAHHDPPRALRSEEHQSELPSLMRNSYALFYLKKKIP